MLLIITNTFTQEMSFLARVSHGAIIISVQHTSQIEA